MKVLHVLYQSLPTKQGTSIRSRDLMRSQRDLGLEVLAITSPFQEPLEIGSKVESIDGMKIYRTFSNRRLIASDKKSSLLIRIVKLLKIFSFTFALYRIAKKEKVTRIHAHATFFTGIAGKIVAKLLGIPFIYEVRSLWEEGAREKKVQTLFSRLQKSIIIIFENFVCNSADRLIVINDNLGEKLKQRGVKKAITTIPNAFYFQSLNINTPINWPRQSKVAFGFIGNINFYEGLELIIAVADRFPEHKFHFWGNGKDLEIFKEKITGIPNIIYNGILSPERIAEAYSEIDIVLNPRLASELTNNVTPLKPIESMGYGKLVIASDIGGMREIITPFETGLLFRDRDANNFSEILEWAIAATNKEKINTILIQARKYVFEKRNWANNAKAYKELYENIQN